MIYYVKQDGYIESSVAGATVDDLKGITRVPDGCTAMFFDDVEHPELVSNYGAYKIVDGAPVALTATEIAARDASTPPYEPSMEEKLAALEEQNSTLKERNYSIEKSLNETTGLLSDVLDGLLEKGVL